MKNLFINIQNSFDNLKEIGILTFVMFFLPLAFTTMFIFIILSYISPILLVKFIIYSNKGSKELGRRKLNYKESKEFCFKHLGYIKENNSDRISRFMSRIAFHVITTRYKNEYTLWKMKDFSNEEED